LSLTAALRRCRDRGVAVGTVIDIGASNGCWSLAARRYFPAASYYLIEAQREHEDALVRLKTRLGKLDYVIAAAGDAEGEIYFDASDLFGGVAGHEPFAENGIVVPMVTVDGEASRRGLQPPYLLKLDTHGFEVPILEGASETLRGASLVIIEAYNYRLTDVSLRFHELCAYMEERGFRCVDMCDPMHRSTDGALWQFDLFFAPTTDRVFESNSYSQ
jgi:FkbM family methyltransferase